MTDLTDAELHDLLDRSTDAIESPALAAPALHLARRRRTRRRGAAAAVIVSGVVATVLVATHLGGSTGVAPPTAPTRPPPTERTDGPVVQRVWDPREAVDLPPAPDGIAAALPESIDPPGTSPALADEPIPAAVVLVKERGVAQVLSTSGDWRSVPLLNEYSAVALSPGGTRLAVWQSAGNGRPATVYDVASGESRIVPLPESYVPSNATWWTFLDDDTLLLNSDGRGWTVDATTGAAENFPHRVEAFADIDPSGVLLTTDAALEPEVLTDNADGTSRQVSMARTGSLTTLRANAGTVVGTSEEFQDEELAVVVADRRSLTPLVSLPLRDPDHSFGFGRLKVTAIADDETVLLRVPDFDPRLGGVRVVAWEPTSGDLSLVSTYVGVASPIFADALLREVPDPEATESTIDPSVVQAPLTFPLDLPQERSLTIPADLATESDSEGPGGTVMAMQTTDGEVTLVGAGGAEVADDLPEGTLFRHSLAGDGGAVALRTEAGFTVYSMFDERATDYDVARTGDSGLWLEDSVGFVYDVPGPGGVSREHEPPFSEDSMGFPAGGDLDEMDVHPTGGAHELVEGDYVRWADYQDEAARIDLSTLGDLRGPAASEDRLAVVLDGADEDGVLVLDHDGTPEAFLPVDGIDVDAVVLHRWVDRARLLVQVGDRLVLWEVDGQRLSQVSVLPPGAVVSIGDGDGSLVRR